MKRKKKWLIGLCVGFFVVGIVGMSFAMTRERTEFLKTKPYRGITIKVLSLKANISETAVHFAKQWNELTGGNCRVVSVPFAAFHQKVFMDLVTGRGEYDAFINGDWFYGDYFLPEKPYIISIEQFMDDPKYPEWDPESLLPALQTVYKWNGKWYGVPNDCDSHVMYYRRDILTNPEYQARFKTKYGYDLPAPPETVDQFLDVAEFFNGWDWDKDGKKDYGVTMHMRTGGQGMFHFISWAAAYVISPENARFWFNPETLDPLINSPGHVKALEDFVRLVKYGPPAMLGWDLGEAWDLALKGDAVLTFTWGDLGALAQDEKESVIKGKIGAAPMPGTMRAYDPIAKKWIEFDKPNRVGNVLGGSWHGVISRYSKHPEITYDFLSYMAEKDNAFWAFVRGYTGIDPGRTFAFLEPYGTADIKDYTEQGWHLDDVKPYTDAYYLNYTNPLQLPPMRISRADEYLRALDVAQARVAMGELAAKEALDDLHGVFQEITDRVGKDKQMRIFKEAMGLK
ncbi:hypothetical protein ES702_06864 [subsurface metagenome]